MKEEMIGKFKVHEIKVVQRTIMISQRIGWDLDNISEVLKAIEREKGFIGFTKIHFEKDSFPEITYFVNVEKMRC